jgi:hypothetical protein
MERRAYSAPREYPSAYIWPRAAASAGSSYYANTICIFFVRMYECRRIHVARTYVRDTNVKSFRRVSRLARPGTHPVKVVPTRSSRNLGNFFRAPLSLSLSLSLCHPVRLLPAPLPHPTATGNCANFSMRMPSESQSRGFGGTATSKLLLFPDLEPLPTHPSLPPILLCASSYVSRYEPAR